MNRRWDVYAGQRDGVHGLVYADFSTDPRGVRMHGHADVHAVTLVEDADGDLLGWVSYADLAAGRDQVVMVQHHRVFEVQFPGGSHRDVNTGRGEVVRLRAEPRNAGAGDPHPVTLRVEDGWYTIEHDHPATCTGHPDECPVQELVDDHGSSVLFDEFTHGGMPDPADLTPAEAAAVNGTTRWVVVTRATSRYVTAGGEGYAVDYDTTWTDDPDQPAIATTTAPVLSGGPGTGTSPVPSASARLRTAARAHLTTAAPDHEQNGTSR